MLPANPLFLRSIHIPNLSAGLECFVPVLLLLVAFVLALWRHLCLHPSGHAGRCVLR
jgi:hypothetical protein